MLIKESRILLGIRKSRILLAWQNHLITSITRMHSSRMRTVCWALGGGGLPGGLSAQGMSAHGGVWPGGCLPRGVSAERDVWPGGCVSHITHGGDRSVDRMTDACENITLPQLVPYDRLVQITHWILKSKFSVLKGDALYLPVCHEIVDPRISRNNLSHDIKI